MATLPFPGWDLVPEGFLTEAEAKVYLVPYVPTLATLWYASWERFRSVPHEMRADIRPVTRANLLHDFVVRAARTEFARDCWRGDVVSCDNLGFFKLYLGDKVVVRLKRLNYEWVAANIDTDQQEHWYRNLPMEGIRSGVTRLTVGYILNQVETDIDHVRVSLQDGIHQLVYSFRLDAEPQIRTLPGPVPQGPDSPRPRIIPTDPGNPKVGEQ